MTTINLSDAQTAKLAREADAMSDTQVLRFLSSLGADLAEGAEPAALELSLAELLGPRHERILDGIRQRIQAERDAF